MNPNFRLVFSADSAVVISEDGTVFPITHDEGMMLLRGVPSPEATHIHLAGAVKPAPCSAHAAD